MIQPFLKLGIELSTKFSIPQKPTQKGVIYCYFMRLKGTRVFFKALVNMTK